VLLLAPASWSVQTLGHATSSTFPSGGPVSAQSMGGGFGGGRPPAMTQSAGAGGPGGGMFGGDTAEVSSALTYIKANGGGTLVISSQSGAASSIIASGAGIAALGGFSGSETTVTVEWLADMVEQGKIRWIIVSSASNAGMRDGRAGSSEAMSVAAEVGTAVSSVDGLYDLQGTADAIRAAA
jgi:hypothetical protein